MEPKKIFLYEVSMTFQMMIGGGIVAAIGRDMRVRLFFNHFSTFSFIFPNNSFLFTVNSRSVKLFV